MVSIYGSDLDWDRIELLSSAIQDIWALSFSKILSEFSHPSTHILDLGCGSGHLSASVLSKIPLSNLRYTGVDLDPNALLRAKRRLSSLNLIQDSALSPSVTSMALESTDIIISLSNTFLCLGNHIELSQFLTSIRPPQGSNKTLILSVVPWGNFQKSYSNFFKDWYHLQNTSRDCWVKMEVFESKQEIEQKVHIKDGTTTPSTITHRFLKMTAQEMTSFFEKNGWNIQSWRSPLDGTAVNPLTEELPEFFIVCTPTNALYNATYI